MPGFGSDNPLFDAILLEVFQKQGVRQIITILHRQGSYNTGPSETPKTPQNPRFAKKGIFGKTRKIPGFHRDILRARNAGWGLFWRF